MLSLPQVTDVCQPNWDYTKTCRYLDSIYTKGGKYVHVCTKLNQGAYDDLCKKQNYYNQDRNKMPVNCKGYLYLLHKEQGYDVK